jgi:hypothetical protein
VHTAHFLDARANRVGGMLHLRCPLSAEPGFVIPGGCGEVRAGIILRIAKLRTLSCMKANGASHDT